MSFTSLEFALFFPAVVILYFSLAHKRQWILLLLVSCAFYMAFIPAYILILAFIILVDYVAALLIEGSAGRTRRGFLLTSIVANIGALAVRTCPFVPWPGQDQLPIDCG